MVKWIVVREVRSVVWIIITRTRTGPGPLGSLKMGSSRELLCLRWEDFGTHFSSSFQDLRDQRNGSADSFFDVSLAVADDDRLVQAHKVILSTCSPFFRNVLAKQSRASPLGGLLHPVIFLRGISAHDLRNVLDFMYKGEVNVAQEELDAFLAVAEDLKIRGLTQGAEESGGGGGIRSKSEGGVKRGAQQQTPSTDGAPRKRPNLKAGGLTHQSQQQSKGEAVLKTEPSASTSGASQHHVDDTLVIDPPDDGRDDGMAFDEAAAAAGDDFGAEDYGDFGADESGDMSYGEAAAASMMEPGGAAESTDSAKGRKSKRGVIIRVIGFFVLVEGNKKTDIGT